MTAREDEAWRVMESAANTGNSLRTDVQISIAISLKRIADAMQPVNVMADDTLEDDVSRDDRLVDVFHVFQDRTERLFNFGVPYRDAVVTLRHPGQAQKRSGEWESVKIVLRWHRTRMESYVPGEDTIVARGQFMDGAA